MTFQNASVAGPDRRRWIALAVVLTASFMDLVDATIVNIAIPSIQEDTGASFGAIQWITAGYALAFAIGLITGGRLGDIYGRRRVFLLGMGGFTVASLLCGVAADPAMLVGSRVLQGAMAALMVPQVLSIIHVTFPAEERGKVFGMFGAVAGLGAVSGPMIGALLTEWDLFGLAWRPIFLINLPVGIAGLILGRRFITESTAPDAMRLDLRGVLLATAGLLMLLYPITMGHENDWPAWGFVSMAASLPVFAAFVAYQKRKQRTDGAPLVELSLFRVKSFAAGIGVQLAFSTGLGIFFLVWTLYMQLGLGWSALHAGLTGLPFSLACSVAAGISVQQLTPRFGRKVLHGGAVLMAAGALLYLTAADRYGTEISTWQMVLPLALLGGGMGLVFAPLTNAVLSGVPRRHAGSASGLINTTNQLGMALGLGLVSVVFFGAMDEPAAPREAGPAFAGAFENAMWWVMAILGVVYALLFFLPKTTAPQAQEPVDRPTEPEQQKELAAV
ncbi:MFS transporter [Streptomyces aculeolatus]